MVAVVSNDVDTLLEKIMDSIFHSSDIGKILIDSDHILELVGISPDEFQIDDLRKDFPPLYFRLYIKSLSLADQLFQEAPNQDEMRDVFLKMIEKIPYILFSKLSSIDKYKEVSSKEDIFFNGLANYLQSINRTLPDQINKLFDRQNNEAATEAMNSLETGSSEYVSFIVKKLNDWLQGGSDSSYANKIMILRKNANPYIDTDNSQVIYEEDLELSLQVLQKINLFCKAYDFLKINQNLNLDLFIDLKEKKPTNMADEVLSNFIHNNISEIMKNLSTGINAANLVVFALQSAPRSLQNKN